MNNYTADFSININRQFVNTVPAIKIKFDTEEVFAGLLDLDKCINFTSPGRPPGLYRLNIEFYNKDYTEYINYNKDQYVSIESVYVEKYPHNFAIYSKYFPEYPEPWKSQQLEQGIKLKEQIHSNYMGWNGIWQLDVELPIYRWIHKTVNLGWLI